MKIKDLFLDNLLYPALAMVLISMVSILNTKLAFVKFANLLILILVTSFLIGLTGLLILLEIPFLPYTYVYVSILFIGVGCFYMYFISKYLIHSNDNINRSAIVVSTVCVLLTGSYIFSVLFNLCSELHYGFIASTSSYSIVLPILFVWTFKSLTDIPSEIHKIWKYNANTLDFDYTSDTTEKIILLELVLSRNPENPDIIKVKAKAPIGLKFGSWFQLFLHDYNTKYFENPIVFANNENELNEWIFYVKKYQLLDKKYIDPDMTMDVNGLKDQTVINCKRVSNLTR